MGLRNEIRDIFWNVKAPLMPPLQKSELCPQSSLLFICKGNICRSPFAEAYAQKKASGSGFHDLVVTSGGLKVSDPEAPPQEALEAAMMLGLSMECSRSQPVTQEMIYSHSLVIAMEWSHVKLLGQQFNLGCSVVNVLAGYDHKQKLSGFDRFNIRDPYGKTVEDFVYCYERISRCIDNLFKQLDS